MKKVNERLLACQIGNEEKTLTTPLIAGEINLSGINLGCALPNNLKLASSHLIMAKVKSHS